MAVPTRATLGILLATFAMAAEVAARGQDLAAPGAKVDGLVRGIKVLPDTAPDCSSLKAIVESVTRGCRTNDQKAVALYNFMRLTHYHRQYPSEPGGVPALKEINSYGWSLCGGEHLVQTALWRELGWDWRFVGWSNPGHTTVEAFYDGRWHYLDVFLKFYAWMPDPKNPGRRIIAGQDDIAADIKGLLADAFVFDKARKVYYAKDDQFAIAGGRANWTAPAFLTCGDEMEGVVSGIKSRNRSGSPDNWAGLNQAAGDYSADVDLAPGFALTNTWDKLGPDAWFWAGSATGPAHTCGNKEIRNSPEKGLVAEPYLGPGWDRESYANGTLQFAPDLSRVDGLKSFAASENVRIAGGQAVPVEAGKPASVTVLLRSPYILTQATGSAEGVEKLEVSTDGGKTWQAAELKDFGAAVKGHVSALLRLTIQGALKDLRIAATVQNNPFALPFLAPGKNTVTVSAADPAALGDNRLVVTYAYRPGSRSKSYEQLYQEDKEVAKGHNAAWEETPTVVRKAFTAKDLPARFDIDLPTPKGKHPVYPRMLFVRREVLSPGQNPLPVPEGAQPPKRAAGDELKTLPSPFTTGIEPPPGGLGRK